MRALTLAPKICGREAVHEIVILVAAADDDDRGGDAVAADGLDDIKAFHIAQGDVH